MKKWGSRTPNARADGMRNHGVNDEGWILHDFLALCQRTAQYEAALVTAERGRARTPGVHGCPDLLRDR